MRSAGTFAIVNGQNVIQGRPEDQPNAPLGTYPINDGDTVLLVASAQLTRPALTAPRRRR